MGEFNKPSDKIIMWVVFMIMGYPVIRRTFFFLLGVLLYLGADRVIRWLF